MIEWIISLPRNAKRLIAIVFDLLLLPLTILLAFCLRLDELYVPDIRVATVTLLTTATTLAVFTRLGLYRAVIRFVGAQVLTSIFIGTCVSALALTFFGFLLQADIPRSLPFIYFGLTVIAVGGSRLALRALLKVETRRGEHKVVIYGAGSAGIQLATALMEGVEYQPVAFIDDDPGKRGTDLLGLPVTSPLGLRGLMRDRKVANIFVAISRIKESDRARILKFLTRFEVNVKIIPSYAEVAAGKASIAELRDVELEDLLGRDSVVPDEALLTRAAKGKVIMVTGAGGSIGSELCRQIAGLNPRMLILFEASEFGLYTIEAELEKLYGTEGPAIKAILGDVKDEDMLKRVMKHFGVQTVYHAAAYKHVPIVERNIIMGVRTNVLGTRNAARAAKESGVENFILISTDKAVRPTNVMGATKRIAEQVLQAMALDPNQKTRFSMVRFGNVLGSSGSVVPLFRQQILAGGPVTVTHPEITRYFMTIPEAVQLVLQASAMSQGGDVFVLDMGQPVKIANLAETMIKLMGHTVKTSDQPQGDIAIEFSGLRPGEKLYEELLLGANCIGTEHHMITRATESHLPETELNRLLELLEQACARGETAQTVSLIKECVVEYLPADRIFDHLFQPIARVVPLSLPESRSS